MADLLSAEHLIALALIVVASACAVLVPRRWPGGWTGPACLVLAVALVMFEVSWWVFVAAGGVPGSVPAYSLPLQLCDAAILVAAVALWTRRQILIEVTYFWGLAGAVQALLTPDLPQHFPSFPYWQYYLAHGGVVVAALFLVAGLGLRPRLFSAVRVAGITVAYAAGVGLVDALTGANYMYLHFKPPSPTLLDAMGPWPWYIGGGAVMAAVLLVALEAPLHIRPRAAAASVAPASPAAK